MCYSASKRCTNVPRHISDRPPRRRLGVHGQRCVLGAVSDPRGGACGGPHGRRRAAPARAHGDDRIRRRERPLAHRDGRRQRSSGHRRRGHELIGDAATEDGLSAAHPTSSEPLPCPLLPPYSPQAPSVTSKQNMAGRWYPTRVFAWLLATACAAHAGEATEAASGAAGQSKLMIGSMLMTDYIYRGDISRSVSLALGKRHEPCFSLESRAFSPDHCNHDLSG